MVELDFFRVLLVCLFLLVSSCDSSNQVVSDMAAPVETEGAEGAEGPELDAVPRPRIILSIMLDDADMHDFGFNSIDAVTPNIDKLKDAGVYFSEFYAGSSICSPTRISLLTGEEPIKFGLNRLWPDVKSQWVDPADSEDSQYYLAQRGLPDGVETIASLARESEYETFHIGKWHAGNAKREFWPDSKGFDSFKIMNVVPYEGLMPVYTEEGKVEVDYSWRSTYQADEIIRKIENIDKDIFINWWPIEPHFPWYVPTDFTETVNDSCCNFDLSSNRGKVLSMMYSLDLEIGRVIEVLKKQGVYDDTLLMVFSDNGGQKTVLSPQRSLSGFKNTLSEGGIKVPLIVSWPRAAKLNGVSNKIVTTMDVFPTFAEIFEKEESVSGESFFGEIVKPSVSNSRDKKGHLWYLRPYSVKKFWEDELIDEMAFRSGCYKVIKKTGSYLNDWKLYDVCNDPFELLDLSFAMPEIHAELGEAMYQSISEKSRAAKFESFSQIVELEQTKLLDVHQDDITVTTDFISSKNIKPVTNIYKRERSLEVYLDQRSEESNKVEVALFGVSTKGSSPTILEVKLSGSVDKDGEKHTMTFVAQGYLLTGTAFELYIDGVLVDRKFPALDSESISESVFALRNSDALSYAGDDNEQLSNYYIYKLAVRPSSPLWRR